MYETIPGYDAWATAGPPDWAPGTCPECGTSQEDAHYQPLTGISTCWECGREYDDEEAHR